MKILSAIVAASMLAFTPAMAKAQSTKTIRYEKCYTSDGFNAGASLFLAYLLDERTRKCVDGDYKPFLSPKGYHSCTVVMQAGRYINRDCPEDVFKQVR